MGGIDYTPAEGRARQEIDVMLESAGWVVQSRSNLNIVDYQGVAVREFTLKEGHGRVDYLLFIDQTAVGTIEAKPAGTTLTEVELQSLKYITGLPEEMDSVFERLPLAYESTGRETRFTNGFDPDPRSRRVFSFHRPETVVGWLTEHRSDQEPTSLARLQSMPPLITDNLWRNQSTAIRNLEESLGQGRRRALIQMATGSGKTFTAANASYRLIKYGGFRRILFLVDRANLGRQTFKEFGQFSTPDDGRKFTELYNVQHLTHNKIDPVSRVTIGTIQRVYSILRGEAELAEEDDEKGGESVEPSRPVEVSYNPAVPPETFDLVIVDECHRSIYGVWRQVLEYFDATIVGLTATPSKQTYGFFDGNLVMEYGREQAVADGVNVDFDVYRIRTDITERGSTIDADSFVYRRDRETREMRWEKLDEDIEYEAKDLDKVVVSRDQIRTVVRAFRDGLPAMFPGRTRVPKTLIFAKDDSHADDIVQVVREEFGKGNEFAVKITYRADRPEELLANFRNSFDPRIVVSVDMIATGTDVKPIEIVMFMRSVKSRIYFEQMIGRGARVINRTDLESVTPDAGAKTHFVIVDAVGVTETNLIDSRPLERRPGTPLRKLLQNVAAGMATVEDASSLAGRLARLSRQITKEDRERLEGVLGQSLPSLTSALVEATDPDRHLVVAAALAGDGEPTEQDIARARRELVLGAVKPIAANPEFRTLWEDLKRSYEQTLDEVSIDTLIGAGPVTATPEWAKTYTDGFRAYLEEHRNEIDALRFFYSVPWKDRPSFAAIRELALAIERTPQTWTPEGLWKAYQTLDGSRVHGSGKRMLTDLVSLVRYTLGLTDELVPYAEGVDERFRAWLLQQEQAGRVFTDEQRRWLDMIKNHLVTSLGITTDDFDFTPFSQEGGLGKAVQVFGPGLGDLLDELNRELVA
jgi:type I restriction enzyme R subunit